MNIEVCKYCVKAWLQDVYNQTEAVRDISERISRMESALTLRGVSFDKQGVSSTVDDITGERLAQIQELREEWIDTVEGVTGLFREVYDICSPRWPNRYVVFLHEFERLTWGKVAQKVNYSKSTVRMMARSGYGEIYEEMPEERRNVMPKAVERPNIGTF